MKKLKTNKIVKIALLSSLSALIVSSGLFYGTIFTRHLNNHYDNANNLSQSTIEGVSLSSNELATSIAEIKGVDKDLAKAENSFIRFEALKDVPIDVVVDENSVWCMTDNVKQAIKNSVDQYNELFSYINPDYQFRYISKNEYEQNLTNNPFIFVTTNLSIKTNGGNARAVTSPPDAKQSQYGNGFIDNDAVVIISSTATVNLTVEQIQNIVSHEFAHALGIVNHSPNLDSMMNSVGSGLCIQSVDFSKDVLNSMLALYYNSATNPNSYDDILNYINTTVERRENKLVDYIIKTDSSESFKNLNNKEILEAYLNDTKTNTKHQTENNQDIAIKTEEEIKQENLNLYYLNLKQYVQTNNLKISNPNNLVDTTFFSTSIYGQTREITLNSNNTYMLKVYDDSRSIICSGTYTIDKGAIVCDGEFFEVVDGNYQAINDTIYISLLSNGECVYSTKTHNCIIIDSLYNSLDNQLTK